MAQFKVSARMAAEVRRLNKSISTKKSRLKKQFGVTVDIERLNPKTITSRQQYNEFVKQAKHFTNRNNYRYVKNRHGIVVSRQEYGMLADNIRKANRIARATLKKVDQMAYTSRGEKTGMRVVDRRMMKDPIYDYLRSKTTKSVFDQARSYEQFFSIMEREEGRATQEHWNAKRTLFQQNFISALNNTFGEEASDIIAVVAGLTPKEFEMLYLTEDIMDFSFVYDENQPESSRLGYIRASIDRYIEKLQE